MKCFRWGMPWYQPKRRKSIPQNCICLLVLLAKNKDKHFYMEIVHDDNEIDAKKAEKITKKKKRIFRDLKSNKFFFLVFVFYLPFFPIWICWWILNNENNNALNIICLFLLSHTGYIFSFWFLIPNEIYRKFSTFSNTHTINRILKLFCFFSYHSLTWVSITWKVL